MAFIKNLVIDQGSSYAKMIGLSGANKLPYDFTGLNLTGAIKKAPTSQTITATFVVIAPTPTDGKIYLSLTDEETAAIKPGRYQYDILASNTDTGERFRVIQGLVTVSAAITPPP